ncbi:MAG: hypothetical protein RIB59_14455, partial [Rhodospirillales bacterium]
LVAVVPLWIWPSDASGYLIELAVSVAKVTGWLVGIAAILFISSVALAALSDALLKQNLRSDEDHPSGAANEQA